MPVRSTAPNVKRLFLIADAVLILSMGTLSYSWHHEAGEDVSSVLSVKDSDKVSGMNTDKSNSDYSSSAAL
jgi:hypothetical protein